MEQDIVGYQRRVFECLYAEGSLNQDVVSRITEVLKAAVSMGQTHARVQTLYLARGQYGYSRKPPYSSTYDHVLYHAHTMTVLQNCRTRVHFDRRVQELVEWLCRHQGLKVICATQSTTPYETMKNGMEIGLAPFVYLYAVMMPVVPSIVVDRELPWNCMFSQKCLDASMIPVWNARCVAAVRAGATKTVIFAMYRGCDYMSLEPNDTTATEKDAVAVSRPPPCDYLSCKPATGNSNNVVLIGGLTRFSILLVWARQLGYRWTLAGPTERDTQTNLRVLAGPWAYFIILFDPVEAYT